MNWREMVREDALAWRGPNKGVVLGVWWNVVLLLLSVGALPFDKRTVLGLNPWIKPIKFEISIIIFLLSMGLLLAGLGRLGALPRTRRWMAWGFGLAMIVENTIIAMQSLRGVRSHMNYTSWFNAMSFATMGVFIGINTALLALLLVLFLKTRTGLPQPVLWGTRLGLALMLAGALEGGMMITHFGAHTVGGADGGPGLPFLNWSTHHGDMRVAHFFAMHALQAFVLMGWMMSRVRMQQSMQTAATVTFAAGYSGVVWLLFAQALRAEPLWAWRL